MKNIIVAVVGLCGSGKTEATNIFTKKGFKKVYLGDVTFEEMKRQNLPITPDNERKIREYLRSQNDMAIYAKLSNDKVKNYFEKGENVVIESMYSWSEYKFFKEIYKDNFLVLTIATDKHLRVERLKNRPFRPLSEKEVQTRDYTEIENIEKGGPVAIADHFILNNSSLQNFQKEVENYIEEITHENLF